MRSVTQRAFHLLSENWRICITAAAAGGFQPREAGFDFEALTDLWLGTAKAKQRTYQLCLHHFLKKKKKESRYQRAQPKIIRIWPSKTELLIWGSKIITLLSHFPQRPGDFLAFLTAKNWLSNGRPSSYWNKNTLWWTRPDIVWNWCRKSSSKQKEQVVH